MRQKCKPGDQEASKAVLRSTNDGHRGTTNWSTPLTDASCNLAAYLPTCGRGQLQRKWLSKNIRIAIFSLAIQFVHILRSKLKSTHSWQDGNATVNRWKEFNNKRNLPTPSLRECNSSVNGAVAPSCSIMSAPSLSDAISQRTPAATR